MKSQHRKRFQKHGATEMLEVRCLLTSLALIEDINTISKHSQPTSFHEHGDNVYFVASTPEECCAIFKTNGTETGTTAVLTKGGGALQATTKKNSAAFVTFDESLFAIATPQQGFGEGIWKLDSDSDSFEYVFPFDSPRQILTLDDGLYIGSDSGLFQIDLETLTTNQISSIRFGNYAHVGTGVVFTGEESEFGYELYFTDGTIEGTHLVEDIRPGSASSGPREFYTVDDTVYFTAFQDQYGIWATDGESVEQVTSFTAANSSPRVVGSTRNQVLTLERDGLLKAFDRETRELTSFFSLSTAGNSYSGNEDDKIIFAHRDAVFATDGTRANTARVVELEGSGTTFPLVHESAFGRLVGADELWLDDAAHWVELNNATQSSRLSNAEPFEDGFVFEANPTLMAADEAIYTTDGTLIAPLEDRWHNSNFSDLKDPRVVGNLLFVNGEHRNGSHRVAVTDGRDTPRGVWQGSESSHTMSSDNTLFILDEDEGTVWNTSGEKATLVPGLPRIPRKMWLSATSAHGVFVSVSRTHDNSTSYDLWFTDGNTSTKLLSDSPRFQFGDRGGRRQLIRVENEIWTTDGTEEGTRLIGTRESIEGSGALPYVSDAIEIGNDWYVLARLGRQSELRTYDTHTLELKNRLFFDEFLSDLYEAPGGVYATSHSDLWYSDGNSDGTRHLLASGHQISNIVGVGDSVLVGRYDSDNEVYLLDELRDGTLEQVSSNMILNGLVSAGGRHLLRGSTPDFGDEPFRLDLSPAIGTEHFKVGQEGETNDAAVFLLSQPNDDVTLDVEISNPDLATTIGSLTFSPENWFVPQSVDLTFLTNSHFGDAELQVTISVDEANSSGDYHGLHSVQRTVQVADRTVGAYREGTTVYVVGYGSDDHIEVQTVDDRVAVAIGDRVDTFALKRVSRVVIDSGAGDDSITVAGLPGRVFSGTGDDTVIAGNFNDKIDTGDGNDLIRGNFGDDTVYAGRGHDTIMGGGGKDRLYGNEDEDIIFGSGSDDRIFGGAGHDVLDGRNGDDTVSGGRGHDLIFGGTGHDLLTGNNGRDLLVGGTTIYSGSTSSLQLIAREWTSDREFEVKVANIVDGSGSSDAENPPAFLNRDETVFDDNSVDTLFGSSARDWFFANALFDELSDRNADTEFVY